jgi:hypothetical protein
MSPESLPMFPWCSLNRFKCSLNVPWIGSCYVWAIRVWCLPSRVSSVKLSTRNPYWTRNFILTRNGILLVQHREIQKKIGTQENIWLLVVFQRHEIGDTNLMLFSLRFKDKTSDDCTYTNNKALVVDFCVLLLHFWSQAQRNLSFTCVRLVPNTVRSEFYLSTFGPKYSAIWVLLVQFWSPKQRPTSFLAQARGHGQSNLLPL